MTNRARFQSVYTTELTARMVAHPEEYGGLTPGHVGRIVEKMTVAATIGDISLNANPALKATCRQLGIPVNIPSLRQFLSATGCPSDGLVDPGPPLLGSST